MRPAVLEFGLRAAILALLWWLLTHGDSGSWAIGVPAVAAAAALSLVLAPGRLRRPSLPRLPAFVLYFLRESVAGGVDVVRRALDPAMPLAPAFVTVSVARLEPGQRLIFAVLVSLMPGTLSARLDDDTLRVHALDLRLPIEDNLDRLQTALADLFGVARPGADPQ